MTSIGASRVLVASVSGFIGGTFTRRLAAQGVRVRAGVKSTSSTVGLALPGVEIVLAEVTRADSMTSELTQDCDVVINAAGTVSCSLEAQRAVNVDGARHLTTAMIAAGVSRLVHASSAGVYGFRTPGNVDETTPVDPDKMPYGATRRKGGASRGRVDHRPSRTQTLPCRQSSRPS